MTGSGGGSTMHGPGNPNSPDAVDYEMILEQSALPYQSGYQDSFQMQSTDPEWPLELNLDLNWQDGCGGGQCTESVGGFGGSGLMEESWSPSWWPQGVGPVVLTNSFGTADDFMPWDYSDINVSWPYPNSPFNVNLHRRAQGQMKFRTAGRGAVGQSHLWVISATALRELDPMGQTADWWDDLSPTEPIDPTQIAIGTYGNLDADGNLWVVLPDGEAPDITPRVDGEEHYVYDELPQGPYVHYITANGVDLRTNTPEFCVGQQVTFKLAWESPPGPPSVLDTLQWWTLPPAYVNEEYLYSPACFSYRKDTALLADPAPSCWYTDEPGGKVSMWQNLHLSNGRYVSVAANGSFTIFKPSVTGFTNQASRSFLMLTNSSGDLALAYGDRYNVPPLANGMIWDAVLNSKYDGRRGTTQVIEIYQRVYPLPAIYDSIGDPAVDAAEFYDIGGVGRFINPDGSFNYYATNLDSHEVHLEDYPEVSTSISWWTSMENRFDSADDYIRFKPGTASNDGNIYVTLGIVHWSANGNYSKSSGWVTNSAPAATYSDSNNFPLWNKFHLDN
jgi:hypothetical protein